MSVREIEKSFMRSDLTEFNPGDIVKVYVKVVEGDRTRSQVYEGTVIKKRGSGLNETFTVRKLSYGVGVERIFPTHSDVIEKIKVVKKGKTRRAKLYYLRDKIGKYAKVKEETYIAIATEEKQKVVDGKEPEPVKV